MCVCIDRDTECELCQRFFRDGLTTSFNRILTDEAVTSWKPDIQVCVCVACRMCLFYLEYCMLYIGGGGGWGSLYVIDLSYMMWCQNSVQIL